MKPMRKDMKQALWDLMCWVGGFRDPKIRVEGVQCTDDSKELILINDHADFMCNFEIDDIKTIRGLNTLMCMWSNKGKSSKTDFDDKSIFEFDDYFTGLNSG